MSILKIKKILSDSHELKGDFLDLRVGNAERFMHVITAAQGQNKKAYGVDTWNGIPEPTKKDLCVSNYFLFNKGQFKFDKYGTLQKINSQLPGYNNFVLLNDTNQINDKNFSVIILDQVLYEQTKQSLDFAWERINYGGTIIISDYENKSFGSDLAVSEFLSSKNKDIITNRQLLVGNTRENILIIKCFNPMNDAGIRKIKLREDQLTVAMVLKTGGDTYDYRYVNALANGIRKNTTRNIKIVCLTDNSTGFNKNIDETIKFKHNWPKWWGKIELFRSDIFKDNRVFFIDLDTIIVDNIDQILDIDYDFCALRDFYTLTNIGSGLMYWNTPKVHKIYDEFVKNPDFMMKHYSGGDQQWIDKVKPKNIFFQDVFPKEIVSYKKDCLNSDGSVVISDKTKIICFHGIPRPHTITNEAIRVHWDSR